MCERSRRPKWDCDCELIAKVRADERARVVVEFLSNHGDLATFALGRAAGLDDALGAVKSLQGES